MSSSTSSGTKQPETSKYRQNRLAAYSLAAGVSTLGMAGAAEAAIHYSGPAGIPINQGFSFNVDLNGDTFNDILLKNYVFGGGNYQGATVVFAPGKLVGFTSGLAYATALNAGDPINAATAGPTFYGSMAYGANNPNAQFNNAAGKFVGLSFPAGADTFYGWVRVNVNNAAGTFTIVDWAYEDVSGQGIAAGAVPEPSSLSFLAAGAAGLAMMRRRGYRA